MSDNPKINAPWFQIFASDFLAQTGPLTPSETGIYVKLLSVMHLHAGPIPADLGRLARRVGADMRTFRPALEALIDAGLVVSNDDFLWSPAAQSSIENITRKSKIASENVATRYRKNEQNQRSDSTDVSMLDVRCQIEDTQAPPGPEISLPSQNDNKSVSDRSDEAAREGAAAPSYRVNQAILIPLLGNGRVYKIVSIRPYVLVAKHRSKTGDVSFARMQWQANGRGLCRVISRDEADELPTFSGENREQSA
ncbi:DUF1376 domain-containing protein [Rhizobium ruizarguesonis]|uniref:DUF1376 domain-containing protein n=1 Tax=Rhizobium ruizarguesonis TaxID=2081791 RepID=UPI001031E304|nr:DUF1376 domain-containing protein [Rhizobium ruizarguesonis]TBC78008.1 DUF1376 domain-containing protein [Rhizobium ruizarguesonis]